MVIGLINPLHVVLERLGFSDPEKGAFFFWDEVNDWPSGTLDLLVSSSLLQEAQPMITVECEGCEEKCDMPVVVYPTREDKPGRAFVVCNQHDDMGRINVNFDRMRQWKCTIDALCGFISARLGLRRSEKHGTRAGLWEIGIFTGDKRSQMLCLQANGVLLLVAGSNSVPLADVIENHNDAYSLDGAMIRRLVDAATTADNRYTPSNAKREARKLYTQAMYRDWQKAHRDLRKKHKDKSDTWISQQIAKMPIAKDRNAATIKKNMQS